MATTFVTNYATTTQLLANNDNLVVLEGAGVLRSGENAIQSLNSTAHSNDVTVRGTVYSQSSGIYLNGTSTGAPSGLGEHNIIVGARGSVQSGGVSGSAVLLQGATNSLVNGGEIIAQNFGVSFVHGSGHTVANQGSIRGIHDYGIRFYSSVTYTPVAGTNYITNSGQITGTSGIYSNRAALDLTNSGSITGSLGAGVSANTLTSSTIRNSGTIQGANYSIYFGSGDDSVINSGSLIGNVVFGFGNDLYDGRSGTVSGAVYGGNGNDTLLGGDGDDTLNGGVGADILNGGAGSDTLSYAGGYSSVTIDLATNTASGGNATGDSIARFENLIGSNGSDTLRGNGAANTLVGGIGADRIEGRDGGDWIYGGTGNDILNGGNGNDRIEGGSGHDTLSGGADSDQLFGGVGNDRLYGGEQADYLNGGDDNDYLYGDNGDDLLYGGTGLDRLNGGNDADRLFGDAGNDTLHGDGQADSLYGGDNNDTLYGDNGDDLLYGGTGNDVLNGGNNNDILYGDNGDDDLNGGAQWDALYGGAGADVMDGGNGNDTLDGGIGNDKLTGGANSDVFIFADGFGQDIIFDFNTFDTNEDIDLSGVTAIVDYADLVANHLTQSGGDSIITDGANTITLTGVTNAQLAADDFLF